MSKIFIKAGDFVEGKAGELSFFGKKIKLPSRKVMFSDYFDLGIGADEIPLANISELEVASEDSIKKIGGTVGWGVAGGVALGGVGLLAGLLLGGKDKDIGFVAKFKDGRRLLATTDKDTFEKIQAGCFGKELEPELPIKSCMVSGEGITSKGFGVLAAAGLVALVAYIYYFQYQ